MAKKFFIVSQAPYAEVTVTSEKDAESKQASLQIGFRRYPLSESQKVFDEFKSTSEEPLTAEQEVALLKKHILYIKNASVSIYDEATLEIDEVIIVKDTREAAPVAPFWETSQECLAVLLDHYLDSVPWKGPLITAFINTLFNKNFLEEQAKNS